MDLCLFFTTWHVLWWITQIFRCIRKVNIYFFYLLCFGLCTNIQQRYCYVRRRQYLYVFLTINKCLWRHILCEIFFADIERCWRTFSRRLSLKEDLAIRRSKTNDKTKGPKLWLPTYLFRKKSCWKFDLSWGFCIVKWLIDSQGVGISIRLDACISS